jgi:hypothetical protein
MINQINSKTIVLGDEYDDALRAALGIVLRRNGVIENEKFWGVGGSQEVEILKIKFGNDVITIESETYVGLSITGPISVVDRISEQVHQQLLKSP